jgi:ectoine hydroxylase-related dioxygenase (phytanoyl-CoA dioxygenase family)
VTLPGLFAPEDVDRMRLAFERLEERARTLPTTSMVQGSLYVVEGRRAGPTKIERIVWCGGSEPALAQLGRAPQLLSVAAQLLGSNELDQLINQAHIKRPGDGLYFSFHQDSYHRRYGTPEFSDLNGRGSFVQALTAIDPTGPDNGGLWLVPNSHRAGHLRTVDGRLPTACFNRSDAEPVRLQPGDTLLLHPFTVHGSEPNGSHAPRRLFINGFCFPGANRRSYPGAGAGVRLHAPSEPPPPANAQQTLANAQQTSAQQTLANAQQTLANAQRRRRLA